MDNRSIPDHASRILYHEPPISRASVELHIGQLVLDGFQAMDRAELGAAVQQQLTRLFAEQGVPAGLTAGGELAHLDGGGFRMTPNSSTQMIGSQIARAVYGGLGR